MASFSAKDYAGTQTYFLVSSGTGVVGDPYIQTIALSASSAVIGHVIVDSGTITTVSTVTNLAQMAGAAIAMGTGVRSAGTQRVTIATDDSVPVTGTFWQATQPVSMATAPALVAGSALIGKVGIDQTTNGTTNAVVEVPCTSGGLSTSSALTTAAVYTAQVKASAGQVYKVEISNTSATPIWYRLYNQTGAPASTDGANIIRRGKVPGNSSAVAYINTWNQGLAGFSTGIGIRVTGSSADNDTTAILANDVVSVDYK